jgi:hypothetical protein
MPLYEVTAPGGKKYQVNAPEGATQEDAIEYVATQVIPQQPTPQEATAGMGEAFLGGAKRIGSDIITGVTAPFVGGEEAAQRGIARQEQITERPGASLEEVQKKYKEEGAWPAIKEAISQIPSAITEQAPFLATMWAGAKAGAALPGTPQTKVVTGFIGAAVAPFLAQSGSNIQRQAEEQVAKGEDPNVSLSKAYGGATAQAALDVFSLQFGLGRLLGIKPAQFGTQQAEKLAKEKLALMLAKGTGKTALAEIPTEMTQQLIERAQAGLDLTSPEAVQEYLSAGYTAGLISPIGGPVRALERSDARNYLAVKEEQAKQAMQQSLDAEIARINEAKFTEEEKQRKIAEAEAKARAERNAVLANIYTNPGKTVQEIIEEATGVARPAETKKSLEERQKALETQLNEKAKTYKKALNSPSGVFAKDPFTQQEYELTTGEWLGLTSPDLVSEIESTTPVEEQGERLATDPVTETTFRDMGIGRTAKLHTTLKGLDPLKIEDNRVIRNTLDNYLKTREAEDPRAVAVQDYLNTIPTTEELEYEPAIRDRLRSDLQVSGQPVPISPSEAFAGYDGTGIDRVPDNIREFARGKEPLADTVAIENDLKAIQDEIAKPYKGETLTSRIKKLGGILTKDFKDLARDKSTAALNLSPGLASNKGSELGELINDGLLNDFLPFHLQAFPGSDTRAAAEYIMNQLVSNTRTIPYAEQRARDELQLQHDQLAEALYLQEKEPQNQRAAEFGLTPQEEDANAILRQESAAIKEEGGISPTEEVPGETIAEARAKPKETIGQFLDRATPEKLKAFSRQQLAKDMSDQGRQRRQEVIQALQTERETLVEAFKDTRDPAQRKAIRERGTAIDEELKALGYKPQFAEALQPLPNTGQTSESITSALEDEFGTNVRNMQRRGKLRIVDSVDQLPPNVRGQATPRSVGAFDGEISYIIADRVNPQNARRVLLHEVGEHYGLERMLGRDNYRSALNRLKTLRNSDDVVRNAWNQVKQAYPKLKEGSDPYLKEVMAKVAEEAPNMTLVTRLRGLIKNFLTRLGLYNPDTFTSRDLQDLLVHSLRNSLAKDLNPVLAQGGIQLSEQERAELLGMTDESVLDMIERHANTVVDNVGRGWVTTMSPDQFLQLTTNPGTLARLQKEVEEGKGTFRESLKQKGKFDIKSMKPMFIEVSDFPVRDAGVGDGIPFQYTPEGGYDTQAIKGIPLNVSVKGHEGRHRAIMAKNAGITEMPVMVFSNTAKTKRDIIQKGDTPTLRSQVEGQPPVNLASEMIPIDYANEQNIRGMMQGTDIQFMEVPPDMQGTAVFGRLDASEQSFYNNFVNRFDEFRSNPIGSLQDMFTKARINVASATAGIEEKVIKDFNGAVTNAMNVVRPDILLNQGLESNILAATAAEEGKVDFLDNGLAKVVPDENNINKLVQLREQLGQQINNPIKAKFLVQHYLAARRFNREVELNAQREQNIVNLKAMIAEQRRILRNSQGRGQAEQRNNAEKLMDRYKKLIEFNTKALTGITDEQRNAIPLGLGYADQFPILNQIGSVVDGINRNRIDMLEKAGYYDKDTADFYRSNLGYVPLFRVMLEEMNALHPDMKQFFQGFSNLGREYEFKGSEKDVDDILNNMLKQHFWAVNAAVRNNANFQTAKVVGIHETVTDPITGEEVEKLVTMDKKPDGPAGNLVAPVFINGERKFVEYTDPNLAIGLQSVAPAFNGTIMAFLGKASKIFRLGITANPVFQSYQVVNDAISAGLLSGVKDPYALAKEIIAGFAKDTFNSTDAINKQMARLGIAGGYGKTAQDIFEQSERKYNLANNSLIKNLYDKADKFASKSDLAQRRGIFIRTLLETGGVRQPDGSIQGGNEILAMNRALNIINWQKRGLSNSVRAITHVVPFSNAYIQGMDVLINALRGKGLSGQEARVAQFLFFKTAMTLMGLNLIYSMLIAGDDEYDKQDDRVKFRNYFVPGTDFKMPVRAEISFLTKYLPEQTYQYMLKRGTRDEPDFRKLRQGLSTAFNDAMLSPNLFPQGIRPAVEVLTNYDFYNDRPLIGIGLSRQATKEQFNERTSEFAKWLGSSGIVAPINIDHLVRGTTGTLGSTALYLTDSIANLFYTNKLPERPLRELPIISPLMMRPEGRDKLNDFYDLLQMSNEVSATLNKYVKYGKAEKAREYRKDNAKLIALRGQINSINNRIKTIREQRKLIVENPRMSAEVKRERLEKLDKMMNAAVINVSRIRRNAGL